MRQVIILNSIWGATASRSIGPYLLRHIMQKRGYSTQIIDHCQEFSFDDLIQLVEHFIGPDTICLGISTTFWMDLAKVHRKDEDDQSVPPRLFIQVMRYMKERHPGIKIVLGGAGVRYLLSGVDDVDAFVLGDAEDIFPELLDHWTRGTPPPGSVPWYNSDKPVYNVCVNKTYDISRCDFDWDERDCILPGETLPIEVSRGCIFKCTFCGYPHLGKKKFDYLRNIDQIRQHMLRNYERWGTTHYIIVDDTFNDSELKVDNFLEMSRSLPFKLKFWAYIRADLVHRFDGMAEKLYEAGLQACTIGIETLGALASMNIGKGWSGKHARDFVPKLVHELWHDDVNVMVSLIVGLPGDTVKTCMSTAQWVDDNRLSASFNPLYITPDSKNHVVPFLSEFEKNADKYNIVKGENGDWTAGEWNSTKARAWANHFTINRKTRRLHSMLHVYARTYGIPHEQLINTDIDTVNFLKVPGFRDKMNDYVNRYKQKLLEQK